ncbi:TPA: S1 RNA-binding domain-containing protein [Clostridioides difficile]|nr:S1 RNA-binding domain-containing protein [Clostridioides difficile]HDF2795439.1 S1 RNA-binding domain-containing protein [Clostridioides difficile]
MEEIRVNEESIKIDETNKAGELGPQDSKLMQFIESEGINKIEEESIDSTNRVTNEEQPKRRNNYNGERQKISEYRDLMYQRYIDTCVIQSVERENKDGDIYACAYKDGLKIKIHVEEMDLYLPLSVRKLEGSQFIAAKVRGLRRMVGATISYLVTSIDDENEVVYASRKRALEILRKARPHNINDIVLAKVIDVNDYYAVIEFDGQIGTVGKRDISNSRVYRIQDYFEIGDEVNLKIIKLDEEGCFLSRKELEEDIFDKYIIDKKYYSERGVYIAKIKELSEKLIYLELRRGLTIACNYPVKRNIKLEIGKEITVLLRKIDKDKKQLSGRIF